MASKSDTKEVTGAVTAAAHEFTCERCYNRSTRLKTFSIVTEEDPQPKGADPKVFYVCPVCVVPFMEYQKENAPYSVMSWKEGGGTETIHLKGGGKQKPCTS